MYKVKYYMGSGNLTCRLFKTLHEAIEFSIKSVKTDNLYEIIKVD
jgi:hypothetical protein